MILVVLLDLIFRGLLDFKSTSTHRLAWYRLDNTATLGPSLNQFSYAVWCNWASMCSANYNISKMSPAEFALVNISKFPFTIISWDCVGTDYGYPSSWRTTTSLHWRHNGHDVVSNHQHHHYLLNRVFRRRSKTGELFPQMANNAENVSIWWRHHVFMLNSQHHGYWRLWANVSTDTCICI